jgi:hypothetical protein
MTLIPTQITFRGLSHSDVLEAEIRERVAWLERFCSGIVRCRVIVEVPHRHHRAGRHFHVRIDVTVPGGTPIVVSHVPSRHGELKDVEDEVARKDSDIDGAYRDARVAVHGAFDAMRRRLEDFTRQQRGAVKMHASADQGPSTL